MLYRLENIKRIYNGRTVLDVPHLEIESRQIYTLLGPNGAGKTTLLKILALLEKPSEGEIEFQDKRVAWDKSIVTSRRDLVLLDQSPIMFSGTVSKNVAYGLKIRGIGKSEIRGRVLDALQLVGMERFAENEARGLSGGETKRVALARALALQPKVLLCDEPTANVDKENQEIILDILGRLKNERRTSIIFSTHYLSQSHRLAEKTLVLQNGHLVSGLKENVFHAHCVEKNDGQVLLRMDSGSEFRLPSALCPGQSEYLRLEIDADHVQVQGKNAAIPGDCLSFSGPVCGLEREGDWVRIQVEADVKMLCLIPASRYHEAEVSLDQEVTLCVPYSSVTVKPL